MNTSIDWPNRVLASVALGLLCLQVALPWTAHLFITQDGPSHVYGSVVTWDLLTHPHSKYETVYRLQHELIPNSATTLILRAFVALAGTAHAEQLLVSFVFVFHFFAFAYVFRQGCHWSPLANALIQTYFLTRGYYNFQLGMSACLVLISYGITQIENRTQRGTIVLTLGSAALYLTSLLPLLIAVITLVAIVCWTSRFNMRKLLWLLAALSPGILLTLLYAALSFPMRIPASSGFNWRLFPAYLFQMSAGMSGIAGWVYAALGLSFAMALCFMTAARWKGVRGGLAIAALLLALLAVVGPDQGFGGGEVKLRLIWAAFLFAGVLISNVPLPRFLWIAINAGSAALVIFGLLQARDFNNRANVLAETYLSALDQIPRGSTLVRLEYPMQTGIPTDLLFIPLLHTDSYAAAGSQSIVLSDYEAGSRAFPEGFQPIFTDSQQWLLQLVEAAYVIPPRDIAQLVRTLPVPVDYYVVLGEDSTIPGARSQMPDAISILEASGKKRVISVGSPVLVRVYH